MAKRQSLYVTLDSLLDTRLATLAGISETLAESLLTSGKWHSRRTNALHWIDERIDTALFQKRYQQRDNDLLQSAVMTQMVILIADMAIRASGHISLSGEPFTINITINAYPYRLPASTRKAFEEVLREYITFGDLHWVSLPVMAETPGTLGRFDTVIRHELDEWLHAHHEHLKHGSMAGTEVYFPEDVKGDYAVYCEMHAVPPFREIGLLFSELFGARVTVLRDYSLIEA
jgi:hypothetical protein